MLTKQNIKKIQEWVNMGYPKCPYPNFEWQKARVEKGLGERKQWANCATGAVHVKLNGRKPIAFDRLKKFMIEQDLIGLKSSQSENGYILYHCPSSGIVQAGQLLEYFEHPQISDYDTPEKIKAKYREGGLFQPNNSKIEELNTILQFTFEELCPI